MGIELPKDTVSNPIKESIDASITSTIKNAKQEVIKKEAIFTVAKTDYAASVEQLWWAKKKAGKNCNNPQAKADISAKEAQVSNTWMNFDISLSSLGNSRTHYSKISIFEQYLN